MWLQLEQKLNFISFAAEKEFIPTTESKYWKNKDEEVHKSLQIATSILVRIFLTWNSTWLNFN